MLPGRNLLIWSREKYEPLYYSFSHSCRWPARVLCTSCYSFSHLFFLPTPSLLPFQPFLFHVTLQTLLEPISDKALKTLNQEMIMMDRSARFFFCRLCYSKLNTVQVRTHFYLMHTVNSFSLKSFFMLQFFLKHIMGLEHERKAKMFVNWNDNKQQFPFFCQVKTTPTHNTLQKWATFLSSFWVKC